MQKPGPAAQGKKHSPRRLKALKARNTRKHDERYVGINWITRFQRFNGYSFQRSSWAVGPGYCISRLRRFRRKLAPFLVSLATPTHCSSPCPSDRMSFSVEDYSFEVQGPWGREKQVVVLECFRKKKTLHRIRFLLGNNAL